MTSLCLLWQFRFQTGSIKSGVVEMAGRARRVEFRFQTGSIKRFFLFQGVFPFRGFDSKLVRLKGKTLSAKFTPVLGSFDSKLVRLKA